jgi:hypothetical protein
VTEGRKEEGGRKDGSEEGSEGRKVKGGKVREGMEGRKEGRKE